MSKPDWYSPAIRREHVASLYRLGRVRGVSMTRIVNDLVASLLASAGDEIAHYDPAIHDRKPHRRAADRPAAPIPTIRLAA